MHVQRGKVIHYVVIVVVMDTSTVNLEIFVVKIFS